MTEHQLGFLQLRERGAQGCFVAADDRMQQGIGKLAPDRGADLRDLLDRRKPVEARHQQILQRRGDRERRQRAVEAVALALFDQEPGLEHVLGQFLHEQRHAVSFRDDLRQHFGGEFSPAGDLADKRFRFRAIEAAQRNFGDVGQALSLRLEFRAGGDQHQHRQPPHATT